MLSLTRRFEITITEFIQRGALVNVSSGEIYNAMLPFRLVKKESYGLGSVYTLQVI